MTRVSAQMRPTAGELLAWARSRWASSATYRAETGSGAGREEPDALARRMWREAEQLLMWATGWSRLQLVTSLAHPVDDAVRSRFEEAVERRASAWPLQYIVGYADFCGRTFAVRPGVLIPRPETEVLAAEAIRWIRRNQPKARVLDFGTGSGALAVTIALECPEARVEGVDVSAAAVEVASANAVRLGARVPFSVQDGFVRLERAERAGNRFHVLVSNPPYIPSAEVNTLPFEVRGHEPRVALDGGEDGLNVYRRLAAAGPAWCASGPAAIWLEVGHGQADSVIELFRGSGRWQGWHFHVVRDLRGVDRVVGGERLPGS